VLAARKSAPETIHGDACAHCRGVADFIRDGRREHLTVKEGQTPTRIRYRPLTARERSMIRDEVSRTNPVQNDGESDVDYYGRCERHRATATNLHSFLAAAVALDFPDWQIARIEWDGLQVLPSGFLDALTAQYGDAFLRDFGTWIWLASTATDSQKKTSSPASTASKPTVSTVADASESQSGGSDLPAPTSG
jgi:hypothetical protein